MRYDVVPSYIAGDDVIGFGLQGKWSVKGKRVASGHKTLVCFFVDMLGKKKNTICFAQQTYMLPW